jgi:small subunit ribosomal protein S6
MVTEKETEKVTEVSDGLQDYEMVLIIKPGLESAALETITDNVRRMITDKGGTVSQMEPWGKRKLAYPIKHHLEGNYVLFKFKAEPALNKALETNLRITEEIIRHLLIKID